MSQNQHNQMTFQPKPLVTWSKTLFSAKQADIRPVCKKDFKNERKITSL